MKFLDATLSTPGQNLALDELLLQDADSESASKREHADQKSHASTATVEGNSHAVPGLLRIWRPDRAFVVMGRSSRWSEEVNYSRSHQLGIPILRRFSGGGAVVVAPGCLLYSLLLPLDTGSELRKVNAVHRFILQRMLMAIQPLQPDARWSGTSDLTIHGLKFSGNSLRIGRRWILYHGTFLLDMELSLIGELLPHPPREPQYRAGRNHGDFVTNLRVDEKPLIASLRRVWRADEEGALELPMERILMLANQRYDNRAWIFQR